MAEVSIIVPIFQAARTLPRAIDSVLNQTMPHWQLILVDDGSRDGGFEAARARHHEDQRFIFLGPRANSGPSAARNVGLAAATGQWVAILDADDRWLPDRLERMLGASAAADAVADDLKIFDVVAQADCGSMFGGFEGRHLTLEAHLGPWLGAKGDTGYLKPILRRDFLSECGIKYDEDLRHGEDYVLYAKLLASGARFHLISDALYIYSMPFGPKSKTRSPYSHTKHNGAAIAAALERVRLQYANSLTDREALEMDARINLFWRIDELWDFQDHMRSGRIGRCIEIWMRSDFVRSRAFRSLKRRSLSLLHADNGEPVLGDRPMT